MSRHKALAAAALFVLAAGARPACAQTPASPDPAAVKAGQYALEPQHTQIEFSVSHLGFTSYFGRFSDASGSLRLEPGNPPADALSVSFPAAGVSTTSAKLNDELKGAQWFDAARYPQITFRSTRVVAATLRDATVTGDLTMHGVTRPVSLSVRFVGAGTNPIDGKYTVGFQATGHLKRSDFGIDTYLPLVGNEIAITLSGAFERQD